MQLPHGLVPFRNFWGRLNVFPRSCNALPGLSPPTHLESAPAHSSVPPAAATAAGTSSIKSNIKSPKNTRRAAEKFLGHEGGENSFP